MLELGADLEADLVLIYILINRISSDWPSFIEGINVFKGCEVQIKSFLQIGLPVHTSSSCSLCRLREQVNRVLINYIPDSCRTLLLNYSCKYEQKDIEILRDWDKPEESGIIAEQIKFRDMIENKTSLITLKEKNDFIEYIMQSKENKNTLNPDLAR